MKKGLEYVSHKTSQTIFVGFLVLFVLISITVAANYFTQGAVLESLKRFDSQNAVTEVELKRITVGTASPFTSLDPLNFEFQNRLVLNNSYEGLVALDPSLQVKQALAVTFGKIDETTWEFRLRQGVKFHNGSEMSASDIVRSFRSAMENENSQLKSILSNIEDISANSGKIQIKTKKPDPTFLNKLATVYIYKDFDNGERYGTGPYQISSRSENEVQLTRFDDYWGNLPVLESATFTYIQDKSERFSKFTSGEIDILRDLPYNLLEDVKGASATLMEQPSLEVTFLGFGYKSTEIFKNPEIRQAVIGALNKDEIISGFGGAVRVAPQFVSNGVVGFLPGMQGATRGAKLALQNEEAKPTITDTNLTLDFAVGQNEIAKRIAADMKKLGFTVKLRPLGGREFIDVLHSGKSDMYLLGWKSEFGDAIDFYKVVAHSKSGRLGEFNAGNYSNAKVDSLIAKSDNTWSPLERVKILQQIMEIILVDDALGYPLFETQIIYAVRSGINFSPRIDGYVYVSEIGG